MRVNVQKQVLVVGASRASGVARAAEQERKKKNVYQFFTFVRTNVKLFV